MSDDVPLARPPRRLNAQPGPPAKGGPGPQPADSPARPVESTWAARYEWWDLYFLLVWVGVSAYIVAGDESTAGTAGSIGLLTVIAAWYVAFGRHLMRDEVEDWRCPVYLAGVLALYVPAVLLSTTASFALFAICPQCFMVLRPLAATVTVAGFNLVHGVVLLVRTQDAALFFRELLPVSVLIVAVSAVFGTWAQRVVKQSDERAELIHALEASRAEVARLSHEAGALAERQRLANDIHDTIAQGLSSVVMLIQAAEAEPDRERAHRHLALALETARDNLGEARALVGALTPALDGASLPDALRRLVPRYDATLDVVGTVRPLSTAVDVVLLRAAQEALTNVRKHAGERAAAVVTLRYDATAVSLAVRDDGPGFDLVATTGGYGLSGMRARVEQVSGDLTVSSTPGTGTEVKVTVP